MRAALEDVFVINFTNIFNIFLVFVIFFVMSYVGSVSAAVSNQYNNTTLPKQSHFI